MHTIKYKSMVIAIMVREEREGFWRKKKHNHIPIKLVLD